MFRNEIFEKNLSVIVFFNFKHMLVLAKLLYDFLLGGLTIK